MMGQQVNFFLTPRDVESLEERLRRIAPLLIVRWKSATSKPELFTATNSCGTDPDWLDVYLVRAEELSDVVMHYVPAQGYWLVDIDKSPVIEFDRCYFDKKILRRGRLYFIRGDYAPDGSWVSRSESFLKWARAVLSTTRRALKRREGISYYIGEDALSWLESSGGKLDEL